MLGLTFARLQFESWLIALAQGNRLLQEGGLFAERGSTSGQGNRPFGQPLCLNMSQENGNGNGNGLSAASSPDQLRPVTPVSPGPPSPSPSARNNKAANSGKHPPIPNNRTKK